MHTQFMRRRTHAGPTLKPNDLVDLSRWLGKARALQTHRWSAAEMMDVDPT
jgi:hypothetical protein